MNLSETQSDVTLVITSCNRPDYLKRTVDSFLSKNTYPLAGVIIIDDSGLQGINDFAKGLFGCDVILIYNMRNLGQLASIDIAYSLVHTKYIFHCEEDWEFLRPGFIERSRAILERQPRVVCVWLRSTADTNGCPVDAPLDAGYAYLQTGYRGVWHGFTLNPGLRRFSDYRLIAPFADLVPIAPLPIWRRRFWRLLAPRLGRLPLPMPELAARHPEIRPNSFFSRLAARLREVQEEDLSEYYYRLGFRAVILASEGGFVRHIGTRSTGSMRSKVKIAWQRLRGSSGELS